MSGFVLHPNAYADLEEIWDYIAADNRNAAARVLEEIYRAVGALVRSPHIGHRRSDLSSQSLRFQPVRDLLIAYAPEEKSLLIVAILHGRRSPRLMAALLRERVE
jgi:plasmid stabilization system protein ParE